MFRALQSFNLHGKKVVRGELLTDVPLTNRGTLIRAKFIEPYTPVGRDLSTMKKADLLEYAEQVGVDVPSDARVADIRELLKEVS